MFCKKIKNIDRNFITLLNDCYLTIYIGYSNNITTTVPISNIHDQKNKLDNDDILITNTLFSVFNVIKEYMMEKKQ